MESQPAAPPWSGGPLSGSKTRGVDRPEPLWRPVCEEEEAGGSSSVSKPSLCSQRDASPPSPRTLRAIQAAMSDSSDEEKEGHDKRDGTVSPRTLRAIQQAMMEEDDGIAESCSPNKLQAHVQHPVPQVVISSEEEKEAGDEPKFTDSLNNDHSKFQGNLGGQHLTVRDNLLVSSSEDEVEEVIEQRNRALHSVVLQQPQDTERGELTETRSGRQTEKQDKPERRESEHILITENLDHEEDHRQGAVVPDQKPLSINLPAPLHGKTPSTEHKTEMSPLVAEQKSEESIEIIEERNEDVKRDSSEESESEGNNLCNIS